MSVIALAAGAQLFGSAQQPAQPPPQPPVFRTGASLVRVDVTVIDRHGAPVTDLTAADFEVSEDNLPQTVETFKLVSADGRQAEGDETSLEIRSPEHAAAEAARDDVRVFLLFWDEYHIGRFASAIQGRKALTDFVASAFGPTDLVALMDPLLPTDAIRWTRRRTDLLQAIQKLEGRSHVYLPARSILEEAQLERRDVERLRSEVTVSAMKSAASYLGGIKEGRKAIVFVSEGLPWLDRSDEVSLLQDLVRTANDNNTAIYTLDPRGLGADVADVMWMLADNTGASAFVHRNDPGKVLHQIVTEASAFYLLGYASTRNPADGKFHQIKVRVKRPGVEVRARRGYWAPSTTDLDKAARDAAGETPSHIAEAIASLSSTRPERALDLWVGVARGADDAGRVTLTWSPRTRAPNPAGSGATLTVVAHAEAANETFEAPVAARRLSFSAAPGDAKLSLIIRDEHGATIDEDTRTIAVPDFAQTPLALGSPQVILARNAAELKNVGVDFAPHPGREFARTDRVFVRVPVYGRAASSVLVTARLLSKTGGDLVTLAVTPPRAGLDVYEIDVPLASMARGDFLIAIDASAGDERVAALVPLRIVS